MTKLFISYRRDDSADITGRIYDRLVAKFGKEAVFKDVDTIPLGVNFKKYLEEAVQQCAVELVIIGKQWLEITDENGQRRLDNPRDFVRIEVEAALSRGIPVIPLLVSGASMPPEDHLPPGMAELVYRNGTEVGRDPHFHRDMDRVIASVERWLAAKPGFTLPMLEWCDIPAGEAIIEGEIYTVEAFRMAKYPVTNAQFQAFIDAPDGYRDSSWWDFSVAARDWRTENQAVEPHFRGDKLPREMVCWHESVAFCRWLSVKTNLSISLPTEAQWQRAAQGDDLREYPWGNEFDEAKCNTGVSEIKRTTPVNLYLEGASPYGTMDMSGNVWEWCSSGYYSPEVSSIEGADSRTARGGSWRDGQRFARAACRVRSIPANRDSDFAFRVCVGARPPSQP